MNCLASSTESCSLDPPVDPVEPLSKDLRVLPREEREDLLELGVDIVKEFLEPLLSRDESDDLLDLMGVAIVKEFFDPLLSREESEDLLGLGVERVMPVRVTAGSSFFWVTCSLG